MKKVLKNRRTMSWLIAVLAVILGLNVAWSGAYSGEQAYKRVPSGHALIDLYGYPFLVPQEYFRGKAFGGRQPELALIASLPGVGADGKSAAKEWAQGSPRLLMIGAFPPKLYTKMREGNLYPEQVVENLINLFEGNRHKYDSPFREIEFKRDWPAFVQSNSNQEAQVLDTTHFLAWDLIGTPPEKSFKSTFVVISEGRIIMFGRCDTPRSDRVDYSPNCTSYFQEPGDVFSLRLTYDAARQGNSLIIARQLSERLKTFNKAAVAHLGHGRLAFADN